MFTRAARRGRPAQGQSIVVALLVLLLLGLAGALFVTIIAKNVLNARRASRTVTADQYARAGITFADAQLSGSVDGADWRPPLQFQIANPPTEKREMDRYTAQLKSVANPNGLVMANTEDPDYKYLQAGFTRYNTGAGRFLLRVTYAPVLLKDTSGTFYDPVTKSDPSGALLPVAAAPGKYLKIESIGREGVIDPIDPTTFTNNRTSDRLQAYQVAFKPIGITDYARFETNPDSRSGTANLGVTSRFYAQDTDGQIATPGAYDFLASSGGAAIGQYPIITTYGAADAFKTLPGGAVVPNPVAGSATTITPGGQILAGGGSIHANMPVRFFGKNVVYLNDAGANAPLYQDSVEIAGDLLLNGYQPGTKLDNSDSNAGSGKFQSASLVLNPTDLTKLKTSGTLIVPSNDQGSSNGPFSTQKGLIRDGSTQTDADGLPRGITRLEPPLMDAQEASSRLPRYKAVAVMSPPRTNPETGQPYAAGSSQYGYGRSIYVNNPQDTQENSHSIGGGSTLVDQWLNRTAAPFDKSKGGWNGDFYEPPGVNITLGRQRVTQGSGAAPKQVVAFGMTLTLTDAKWPSADGTSGTDSTKTVLFDDINASNDPAAVPTATSSNPDNDVLIYAEGNVRVHGIVSADPADKGSVPAPNAPTVVTDLVKDKLPRHVTIVTNGTAYIEGSLLKGNPDSSITVLAHDYVCVNTTQFLAGPQSDENEIGTAPAVSATDFLTFGSDETRLIQEFTSGLPNSGTPLAAYGTGSPLGLYVSARSGGDAGTQADFDIVNPATGTSVRPGSPPPFGTDTGGTFSVISAPFGAVGAGTSSFGQQYFSLSNVTDNSLATSPNLSALVQSDVRLLYTRRSPGQENSDVPTASQDLLLQRVAILPMDIRIEAVLYAQTGSFFVIPGNWFNSNSADALDTFVDSFAPAFPNGQRISGADPHFPFYGQPIDMKIIVSGSVSEAQPADVANQTAWMLKWGWIPQYHGYASQGAANSGAPLETAGHTLAGRPAIGLQIIYNPQAGYPYNPGDAVGQNAHYLRSDIYGRPLPFSPKLPVSTGLLFAGESSEPPLLQ